MSFLLLLAALLILARSFRPTGPIMMLLVQVRQGRRGFYGKPQIW